MKKIYFTALIPASNLDNKYKKIQIGSTLSVPLQPMAILESYSSLIAKKDFNKNINILTEFKTQEIKKIGNWWGVSLPKDPLSTIFTGPNLEEFPKNQFFILLGYSDREWDPPILPREVIRNFEVGFYELTMWDDQNPMDNIEIVEHWKIKKKRFIVRDTKN